MGRYLLSLKRLTVLAFGGGKPVLPVLVFGTPMITDGFGGAVQPVGVTSQFFDFT